MKLSTNCGALAQGIGLSSSCVCDFTASENAPLQLNSSGVQPGDLFGFSVRIDASVTSDFSSPGALALVGSPGYNMRRGRVHVFSRNSAAGCHLCPSSFCAASWNEMLTLSHSGSEMGDFFGSSIALTRPSNADLLAVIAISAPLANRTGLVYIYMQNSSRQSFELLQILALDAPAGTCGSACRTQPLFGTAIAMSQDFLAVGCPLCLTMKGTSGAVYLYRWQSSAKQYRLVQFAQGDSVGASIGVLMSNSAGPLSVREGSSFGSSLSLHVSNGGILTVAVSAMHCSYETVSFKVSSVGAVFIFFAEIIPFNGQLLLSVLEKQILSPMTVGMSSPEPEFSLGRSVSLSIDGKSLAVCGGVELCRMMYVFRRADPLGVFSYQSFEDFTVVREGTLHQSFHTASISQDQLGIVGNPFFNKAGGAVFLSSPVHLGFGRSNLDPAVAAMRNVNFDYEIRSPWLHFFYSPSIYNATFY